MSRMKFDDEVAKQLDAVVGESYSPPRRWRFTFAKWGAAVVLAAGMSWLVWTILDTHVTRAQVNAATKRPTQVHILPPSPAGDAPAPMPKR
jgi:hypothetical protein